MEDKKQILLLEYQDALKEDIHRLFNEQDVRLGSLSEWDNNRLLTMDQTLVFWCVDGVIRLDGIPERHNLDWWTIFDGFLQIVVKLSIEDLAKLYYKTGDAKSIICLATFHIDRAATMREFMRRIETQRIGKSFLDCLNNRGTSNEVESLKAFFNALIPPMRGWIKKSNIKKKSGERVLPEGSELLKSLKQPIEEFSKRGILPDVLDKKMNSEESRHQAFITTADFYNKLSKASTPTDPGDFPLGPIAMFRPLPVWDKVAQKMLVEMITDSFRTHLPILKGQMEKAPLAVINANRTISRRERKWEKRRERSDQWANLDDEHFGDRVEFVYQQREGIRTSHERFDISYDIFKTLNRVLMEVRKKPQILKAFQLMCYEDKTEKEAAKIAGITTDTIQNVIKKIRKLPHR